jgi:hypothetical protein
VAIQEVGFAADGIGQQAESVPVVAAGGEFSLERAQVFEEFKCSTEEVAAFEHSPRARKVRRRNARRPSPKGPIECIGAVFVPLHGAAHGGGQRHVFRPFPQRVWLGGELLGAGEQEREQVVALVGDAVANEPDEARVIEQVGLVRGIVPAARAQEIRRQREVGGEASVHRGAERFEPLAAAILHLAFGGGVEALLREEERVLEERLEFLAREGPRRIARLERLDEAERESRSAVRVRAEARADEIGVAVRFLERAFVGFH